MERTDDRQQNRSLGSIPALELRNVSKVFPLGSAQTTVAVDSVDLAVAPGEFVCVLGPSGHGKSTLLNLVAGFIAPTTGEVLVRGRAVTGPGWDRGMVFQRDTLFLWLRVADNIGYGLRARGVPKRERRAIVERLLDEVGLTRFARAWPKELSGGMRRRVAIAAVFANEPDLLLMDEPFSALDYARRAALHQVLLELWGRVRNTVVFVTHDLEEALALADRILIVIGGRIVTETHIALRRPRTADVLASAEANLLRAGLMRQLSVPLEAHEQPITDELGSVLTSGSKSARPSQL